MKESRGVYKGFGAIPKHIGGFINEMELRRA